MLIIHIDRNSLCRKELFRHRWIIWNIRDWGNRLINSYNLVYSSSKYNKPGLEWH